MSIRPSWILTLVAAASLPLYVVRFHILGLPSTLLEALTLAAIASAAVEQLLSRQRTNLKREPQRLLLLGTLLALAGLAAVAYSPQPLAGLGLWRAYFLEPLLLAWLVLSRTSSPKQLRHLLWALVLGGTAVAVYAIYQRLTGYGIPATWQPEDVRRVTSWLGYPNAVGLLLAPLSLLAVGLALPRKTLSARAGERTSWGLAALLCAALMATAVAFAKSEGGLVGLGAGLGLFGLLYSKLSRRVTLVALALVVIATVTVTPLRHYVVSAVTLNDCPVLYECSLSLRRLQWAETWRYLADGHLIPGAGLAGYQTAIAPYHFKQGIEVYLYPHNVLLNFWVEVGLVGLLLFLAVLAYVAAVGLRYLRRASDSGRVLVAAALASLAVSLVHGLVDVPYLKNDLAALFWLTAAVPFVALRLPER